MGTSSPPAALREVSLRGGQPCDARSSGSTRYLNALCDRVHDRHRFRRLTAESSNLDRMRVLQGHGLGAVQDDPAEDTDAEFMDARRAWGQDEMRPVRQAARAILSREAERRAGVCSKFLRTRHCRRRRCRPLGAQAVQLTGGSEIKSRCGRC